MSEFILPDPLEGEELKRRLTEKIIHEPIARGFLYKNASLMLSSQPSVGKSVLAIQGALQISNGVPLFGVFDVVSPTKVWYVQMERSEIESLERIQYMIHASSMHTDNLVVDVELQALNLLNEKHFSYVLKRGHKIKPGVIIVDPLYGIAPGLSKDEVGSNVAKIFTILKKELGCAIWINHHTVKNLYNIIGDRKEMKEDPFYGAQWLKAHVTGSYFIEQTDNGTGTLWTLKKDSHSLLSKELKLNFDHDTYLSTMEDTSFGVWERYKLFINAKFKSTNRAYFFNEALKFLTCAPTTLRELHRTGAFMGSVTAIKTNGRKTLYEVIKEV